MIDFAIEEDFAFIGLVQAVKDLHQRAFTRAIFAQQGMDLPCFHIKIDVVVGQNAREFFDDIPHFQRFDSW